MKKTAVKFVAVFTIFFAGTSAVIMLDNICAQSVGVEGKLVLDVEKWGVFE